MPKPIQACEDANQVLFMVSDSVDGWGLSGRLGETAGVSVGDAQ